MKKITSLLTGLALFATISSCQKDENPGNTTPQDNNFAFWVQVGSWPNANYYVMGLENLNEGKAVLAGNGVDVTTILNNSVICRNGFYYYYNTTEGRFGKYQIVDGQAKMIKQVPYTHVASLAGHTWVDNNTLVILGLDATGKQIRHTTINATDLSITNGTLTGVPAIPETFDKYRLGGDVQYVDGNLFFALTMTRNSDNLLYTKTFVTQVRYPAFTVGSTSSTDKTAGVGNTSGYFATSFVDANKDMYFLTSWNGMWQPNVFAPKMILRVKNGTTVIDPAYQVDVMAITGKEAAAGLFMNLGNGKAILKLQSIPGYTNTLFGYAIIDLATGKEVRKLTEIPEGLGGERNVMVENGKAYIAVLSNSDKDYIWIYDAATDKVTRGLEIEGGYNSFSRLERLQ